MRDCLKLCSGLSIRKINHLDTSNTCGNSCPLAPRETGFCFFDVSTTNADGMALRQHVRNIKESRRPQCHLIIVSHGDLAFDSQVQAVVGGAAGIISDRAEGERIIQAVNATARGEIWASRKVLSAALRELRKTAYLGASEISAASLEPLTPREREVLGMLRHALPTRQIATRLCISPSTVKTHVGRIYQKLDISNRNQILLAFPVNATN